MKMGIFMACLVILASTSVHGFSWDFIYWEAPPFIYKDGNGKLTGIMTEIYDNIQRVCKIGHVFIPRANLKNYTYFGKMLKNEEMTSNYTGYSILENAHGKRAAWFPVLQYVQDTDSFVLKKSLSKSVFFDVKEGIAVLALRDKISFTYKVYIGLKNSAILFLLSTLAALVISGAISICEMFSSTGDLDRHFIKASLSAIWVVCYTTVTVGYGNVKISTLPGRVISVIWMVSSLIIAALLTGTIYDSFAKTRYLDVKDYEVAALAGSTEAHLAEKDWKANIKGYNSYQEIIDAVRSGETTLAIMNYYTAGYYSTKMNKDPSKPAISIVNILKVQVPIYILSHHMPSLANKQAYYCFHKELYNGIEIGRLKHRRKFEEEKIYYPPLADLFTSSNWVTSTMILAAVLIIIGFVFDLLYVAYTRSGGFKWLPKGGRALMNGDAGNKKVSEEKEEPNRLKNLDECIKEYGEIMKEVSNIQKEMTSLSERFSKPVQNVSKTFLIQKQSLIH